MEKLFLSKPYSVDKIAAELGFSTKLENGIRDNFGDPVSINELKLITKRDFLQCRYFGKKSWRQFKKGLSPFYTLESAVTFINQPGIDTVVVKIDTSKPFAEVVQGLAQILREEM